MILRLLATVNLLLLAGVLSTVLLTVVTGYTDAAHWWREAKANDLEWKACETKHTILKRAIRREGLWKRLGLPGQPWLQ